MTAYPFRPPAAKVRDLKGIFPFNNDSIWWKAAYAALPKSKVNGDGSYNFDSRRHDAHAARRAGELRRHALGVSATSVGRARQVRSQAGVERRAAGLSAHQRRRHAGRGARDAATFGITLDDTITIHNTDLRFSGVDTRTLEQLIPDLKSPRRGTFAGRAIVSGGRHALAVNGDVTFNDLSAGDEPRRSRSASRISRARRARDAIFACGCCPCRSTWRGRGCRRCRSAASSPARRR